jgi:LuxR family maltose regulon positive regulatory protein
MAAGDVDTAARMVEELWLPVYRQARVTTLQRWFRWLEERGGIEGHPLAAAYASHLAGTIGRPAEAERWGDVVDRWQSRNADQPGDPVTEATAAMNRAILCRRGVQQMRADADEAAQKYAAAGTVMPVAGAVQGIARLLSGDLDGADAFFEATIAAGRGIGAPDVIAIILAERAMARSQWSHAEAFASQAHAVLRQAGIEDALICVVQARVAMHRGDSAAARQELVTAQRVRPLLTYARPYLAIQARIELTRVHLALGGIAAARTLIREIDAVLKHRPGLGTLVGEAQVLGARLSEERTPSALGASSLTAAELRVLPLLATHLSFPEIGATLHLSPNTIKSQAISLYRKLGVATRSQAVARSRELALLEG